jgi:hypothetical protein
MELTLWQLSLIIALVVIVTLVVASYMVVNYMVRLELGGPPIAFMDSAINIPLCLWGGGGISHSVQEGDTNRSCMKEGSPFGYHL